MAVTVRDIPKLTDTDDYPFWKTSISAAFLILDLASTINTPIPEAPQTSTLPPDPLPFFSLVVDPAASSPPLSESEAQALALIRAKKQEWDTARQAEEITQQTAKALQEREHKRKDELALGWIFMTLEKTLAQEILLLLGKKRDSSGNIKKAELKELSAREVWEKLVAKYDPERQRSI